MYTKEFYTDIFLKAAELSDADKEKLIKTWWYNLRSKKIGGLRLTDDGLTFVKENADIKTYEVDIPKEIKITPQVLLWLDQFIASPWYLMKNKITVLSEKTAFELYLFSGDVKKMGQAKAMAKRLESDLG
jgi:hypothetical protein